jgi:putative phosphoesterase
VRLLLLADTHVPARARDLPTRVWEEVERADVVLHAGDWVDTGLLDRLEAVAGRVFGCYGNNDSADLCARIPEIAQIELAGVSIIVVHETGSAKGREQRIDRRFPGADLIVFGHSHMPWDTTTPAGKRLLNPGSPTDKRRQPHATFQTLELEAGVIGPVTLHKLPN